MTNTTSTDKPLLTLSDAVAAIDGKGPGKNGWYNGHCPAHDDSQASLGIMERPDGSFAVKCQAGCTREQVIQALENQTGKSCKRNGSAKAKRPPVERGITLDQYAEMKKIPREYLETFGTVEYLNDGKPAICHRYVDEHGHYAGLKIRLSTDSHDTFWKDYAGAPYGLAHLSFWQRCAASGWKPYEYVVICEGESDVQTLFACGIAAIGISGKKGWKQEFAELPQIKCVEEIVIVQEPDAEDFVAAVAPSFHDKKVWVVNLPAKDPSELWLLAKVERAPITNPNPTNPVSDNLAARIEAFLVAWNEAIDAARLLNDSFANTDTGNAERLVNKHGGDFRWVNEEGVFCMWNGSIWEKSTKGDVLLPLTKEIVREIPNLDWRLKSESSGKREAMIRMTKGEKDVLARRDVFDKYPMLLNVQNGTLDLEKQELRDFRREDYLTKKAPVSYEIFADCPKFDEFMEFTFGGDQDLIHFMDKGLGYTLTGSTLEQCFFLCYGNGQNGKSTLLELMMQILGHDFVTPAKFSTFAESKYPDQASYDVATLAGARMVTVAEPRKAGRMNEELLKQITGGDMLKARQIYREPFAFHPECKLWFAMNNQPRIAGTDEGIWRRVRFIPFTQKVEKKIAEFHKVLFNSEGPGILNRLLRGLADWQKEGLQMPSAIAKATAEFREGQNVIQGYFDSCTLAGKNSYHAKAGDLYARYRQWAEDSNEFVIRQNEFAEELARRGFIKRRVHQGFEWGGIKLKDAPVESEPDLGLDA